MLLSFKQPKNVAASYCRFNLNQAGVIPIDGKLHSCVSPSLIVQFMEVLAGQMLCGVLK